MRTISALVFDVHYTHTPLYTVILSHSFVLVTDREEAWNPDNLDADSDPDPGIPDADPPIRMLILRMSRCAVFLSALPHR